MRLKRHHFKPYRYTKIRRTNPSSRLMIAIGKACLGVVAAGLLVAASPIAIAEGIILLTKAQRQMNAVAAVFRPPVKPTPTPEATPLPLPTPDPATLPFSISIPKLSLDSKVVSNVNAADEAAYRTALKEGVAHALGSAFPGQKKMVYIFGHSTDYVWNVTTYNALFYQIKDLTAGDEVVLILGDTQYTYSVYSQHIVEANDLALLSEYAEQDVVILQTCYPPGTSWKRLLVIAKAVK